MREVRIGLVGLGRLGTLHAENVSSKIPGARIAALCDADGERLEKVALELGVDKTFTSFEDMAEYAGIDAVCIVSPSALHTQHIRIAMEAGKHVFCEKPLGISVEQCREAVGVVGNHPNLVFSMGFMRRFDPSYAYAKKKIEAGEIGRIVLMRSYSQDPISLIEGAIVFSPHSGGQFIDMAVHDIDLARWFIGSEPKHTWAIGGCYAYPEFGEHKDGDNVSCLMQFEDDAMVFLFAGRTSPHGYNVETEIIGTKGILRIGSVPQKNLVEILDEHGVRKECSQSFGERFGQAFIEEIKDFTECIRSGRRPGVGVSDGLRALEIALGCKASFESGELVKF